MRIFFAIMVATLFSTVALGQTEGDVEDGEFPGVVCEGAEGDCDNTSKCAAFGINGDDCADPGSSSVASSVSGKLIVFNHPRNGLVRIFLDASGSYLATLHSAQTGEQVSEGGTWHAEGDQLCINSALNKPSFSDCGQFIVDGNTATWGHKIARTLTVEIKEFSDQ